MRRPVSTSLPRAERRAAPKPARIPSGDRPAYPPGEGLTWTGIARLGLVQAMLGAVVVLTTSTLNRVMVVELALPALLPGLLVAHHLRRRLARLDRTTRPRRTGARHRRAKLQQLSCDRPFR